MNLAEKGVRDLLTLAIPLDVSKELKSKENSEIVKNSSIDQGENSRFRAVS